MKGINFKKTAALLTALALISGASMLAGCGKSDEAKNNKNSSSSEKKTNEKTDKNKNSDGQSDNASANQNETAASGSNQSGNSAQNEQTKYGNAEVYTDSKGNKAAKTEDGTEVELTSENLQNLMTEYAKVKGSGSEEEKKILDQIQVILEVQQAQAGSGN
ncbi:MAG: hypothetical protein SOW78_10785 [Clostridia bacterium]|nr:hypothetical protein [Clostridia bacterium]